MTNAGRSRVSKGTPTGGQFKAERRKPVMADPVLVNRDDDDDVAFSLAQVALWSGTDDDEAPLDDNFSIDDIDKKSLQVEVAKTQKFWAEATALGLTDWCDKDMFVHNFWLDRNGHGSGFWDHCPDEVMGEQLSEMAKQYGPCDLMEHEEDGSSLSFFPS